MIKTSSDGLIGAKRAPLTHGGDVVTVASARPIAGNMQLAPSPLHIAQEFQNMWQNDFGIVKGRKMIEAGKRHKCIREVSSS